MKGIRNLVIGVIGGFIGLLLLPEMQLEGDIIRGNPLDAFTVSSHYLVIGYLAIKAWKKE